LYAAELLLPCTIFLRQYVYTLTLNYQLSPLVPLSSLPTDPTFTLTNVTTAIESVEDWDDLGYFLLVPYEKRGNREEMLRYFITTMPNASWETLAGGLYRQQEHAALETATKFFKPKPGKE